MDEKARDGQQVARTRNLKPSFFTNELLAELPPLTRILYAGLWTIADREGKLEERPKRIKASILPYDDYSVTDGLKALHDCGFVVRYEVGGERYVWIPKFTEHQYGLTKEPESQIPQPFTINCKSSPKELQESSNSSLPRAGASPYSILHTPIPIPLDFCSEAPSTASEPDSKVSLESIEPQPDASLIVFDFPTRGKPNVWQLTKTKVAEYEISYPGIDVLGECRRARQWCIDNKEKRKSAGRMPAFLVRWLNTACDKRAGKVSEGSKDKAAQKARAAETKQRQEKSNSAASASAQERAYLAKWKEVWDELPAEDRAARIRKAAGKGLNLVGAAIAEEVAISQFAKEQNSSVPIGGF